MAKNSKERRGHWPLLPVRGLVRRFGEVPVVVGLDLDVHQAPQSPRQIATEPASPPC